MITYQLTLKGYNIEDAGTDHLIKWVNAPGYHTLEAFVNRCQVFDLLDEMPQEIGYGTEEDGVDLVIEPAPNRDEYAPVVEGWQKEIASVMKNKNRLKSKYVASITVTDPDSSLPVELEIRKLDSGAMVGIDGSYLEQDVGPVFSPYDPGVEIDIPDNEPSTNRLTAATPEELDALELPFDWHSACVVTTTPDLTSPEDRSECQRLANIPIWRKAAYDFDACNAADFVARFISDALNAFVSTPEGLERWKEVLAALSK